MIRRAEVEDLNRIFELYAIARAYMRASGNPHQWGASNPPREKVEADLRQGQLYVVEDGNGIHGVFALIFGDDPTYARIDGAWPDEGPYAVVHRLAGDGSGGVFAAAMDYAKARSAAVRVDTHADNATMHHLLQKHGFVRCGTIWLENGDPRIAYQWNRT